ncbi:uncharacterized protein LOC8280097 isoform X2 [Ricinus communis]|uniref:uncharacterized protein LOC8280097 isoform X2 n=1 Tax=Ricinus communis TaxID=3988 RepID=UPI00201A971C|nr:uncharacterized protein LOC8280097 isoform X2 [Ricinus communis]
MIVTVWLELRPTFIFHGNKQKHSVMSYHNALLISSIPKLVLTNCNDNKKYPNPKSNNPPPAFLGVAAASASLFFTLTIGVSRSSLAAPVSTPIAKIAPIQGFHAISRKKIKAPIKIGWSIGDSWLSFAIQKALIEPIRGVEDQDWFKGLSDKWKVYLRRNCEGSIDPNGEIWGAPYRWGSMVIAYKKSKFQKNKLAPIEDWADLWRPDLKGRISMIDSPREVVGAVLKYMGASYNAKDIELEVHGGKSAVQENLALFGKQVRLFDSMHYLKAFGVGDVWVAVGWSSDVLPVAKRMSNIAVVVPKSGSSLWADLWAIPAASRLATNRIGGRVRGPSPLIHQWIEFCLQAARAMPFKQEVIPGASPSALESTPVEVPEELTRGKPRLDTNLIAGVPPPEILSRCEFLEPLSDAQLLDYKWLIASMQQPGPNLIHRIHPYISSLVRSVGRKSDSKVI